MTDELKTCPVCEDGKLHPKSEFTWEQVVGVKERVPVEMVFSVCDGCESELADGNQINQNAQAMRNARNGEL
jgi:hypothetical protein